jgi:outer membrane protein assembly factor BamB
MNYSFLKRIFNVIEFVVINDGLYFINKSEDLYFNDKEIEKGVYGISTEKKQIFAYKLENESNVTTILFGIDNYRVEIKLPLLSNLFDENTTLFGYDYNSSDKSRKYKIYDLNSNNEVFALKNRYSIGQGIRKKNIVFYRNHSSFIFSLDIYLEKNLWQYSVSEIGKFTWSDCVKTHREEGKVERIIGVFGEVLVCVITGGGERVRGNTQLIGLDTNTGKLLWQIEQYMGTPNRQLPATATLMPDAQNKNLVGFQSGDFIEIDPQTGTVLRYSHINLVYEQYTLLSLMDSFSLLGDYLYFRTSVSSMGGFPTAIGAFNYKTGTIEWLHVFEEFAKEGKFIPINQPKAEGNRVYALDSGNTLHIFEKEETKL